MAAVYVCVFNQTSKLIDITLAADAGPGVAGSPVVLNAAGLIDPSLTNSGTVAITDTGGLSTGTLVTLYIPTSGPHANQLIAQPATAAHPPLVPLPSFPAPVPNGWPSPCLGFVTAATLADDLATVYFYGTFIYNDPLSEFSDASVGRQVFLADSNDTTHGFGAITLTAPTPPAEVQAVGLVTNYNGGLVTVEFVPSFPAGVNFSNILTGTNTGAIMTVGTGATLTVSGTGVVNANQLTGDPVDTSGRTTGQALVWSGTAWTPSSGAMTSFTDINTGVNTTATMTVGTGASIVVSGTGVVEATELATTGAAVVVNGAAPPTTGQALVATSATTAAWQTVTGVPGGTPTQLQFNNTGVFGGASHSSVSGTGAVVLGNVNDPSPNAATAFTVSASGSIAVSAQDWYSSNEGTTVAQMFTSGLLNVNGLHVISNVSIGGVPALSVVGGAAGSPDIADFTTDLGASPASTKTVWIDYNGNLHAGNAIIAPTATVTGVALSVTGDAMTSNVLNIYGRLTSGGTVGGTPAIYVNQFGGMVIQPPGTNVTPALVVKGNPTTQLFAPVTLGDGPPEAVDYGVGIFVEPTTQDPPDGTWAGTDVSMNLLRTTDSAALWWGNRVNILATGAGINFTGTIQGLNMAVVNQATGTCASLFGAVIQVDSLGGNCTNLEGINVLVEGGNSSVSNPVVGIKTHVTIGNSVLVSNLHGYEASLSSGTLSTITGAAGVYVVSPILSTTTVNHLYGVYIEDQTLGTNNQDPYAIFVAGGVSSFTGVAFAIVTKSTTYTVAPNDHTILCTGSFTITLPTTGLKVGQEFVIKNIGTGVITVSSTANIDGSTTYTIGAQYASINVQWDGTQYWII